MSNAGIIVRKPTEREWSEAVEKMWRANLDVLEHQKDAPEKFARAIEAGGNFGLQADYDAAIQRLRAVAANRSWRSDRAVVIVLTPSTPGNAGPVNDYLLSHDDVRMIETAVRSRVADHRKARL